MGRGVSCGGGQSSLSYLFGSGEPATNNAPPAQNRAAATNDAPPQNHAAPLAAQPENNPTAQKPAAPPAQPIDKGIPAGIQGSQANNYLRADGQNCGNFITDRPSTKVHAAPGGGSSLGYLFGGDGK